MGRITISESKLIDMIREAVEETMSNEGLFGPFNLGRRGKRDKGSLERLRAGREYQTAPIGGVDRGSHRPSVEDADKKKGTKDCINYKNAYGVPVTLCYYPDKGFYYAVGDTIQVHYGSSSVADRYRDDPAFKVEPNPEAKPEDYEHAKKISRARPMRPVGDLTYVGRDGRDGVTVGRLQLAKAIYSWCIKVCRKRSHIQFIKKFLDDRKNMKSRNHMNGYFGYDYFLNEQ